MQAELTHDRIQAELAKLIAVAGKLNAETGRINLEATKLSVESKWYPATVGGAILFALVAADKFFLGLG